MPAPRLYCLPATDAPVVAVFLRGPADWSHVGKWNLDTQTYEPGAWLHGRIYPRRCDISPDGRFLSYFALNPKAQWEHGDAYVALSKLPWLKALHAFGTCGTWTRGYYFTAKGDCENSADANLPIPYGLRSIPVVQFANERRRGWQESPDSPPRDPDDMWDQRRNVRLRKPQPDGSAVLHLESVGVAGGEFGIDQAVDGMRVQYSLETDGDLNLLDDVQWADWASDGRLLVATRSGKLQVRDGAEVHAEHDLSSLEPHPAPAPDDAQHW